MCKLLLHACVPTTEWVRSWHIIIKEFICWCTRISIWTIICPVMFTGYKQTHIHITHLTLYLSQSNNGDTEQFVSTHWGLMIQNKIDSENKYTDFHTKKWLFQHFYNFDYSSQVLQHLDHFFGHDKADKSFDSSSSTMKKHIRLFPCEMGSPRGHPISPFHQLLACGF